MATAGAGQCRDWQTSTRAPRARSEYGRTPDLPQTDGHAGRSTCRSRLHDAPVVARGETPEAAARNRATRLKAELWQSIANHQFLPIRQPTALSAHRLWRENR